MSGFDAKSLLETTRCAMWVKNELDLMDRTPTAAALQAIREAYALGRKHAVEEATRDQFNNQGDDQ